MRPTQAAYAMLCYATYATSVTYATYLPVHSGNILLIDRTCH